MTEPFWVNYSICFFRTILACYLTSLLSVQKKKTKQKQTLVYTASLFLKPTNYIFIESPIPACSTVMILCCINWIIIGPRSPNFPHGISLHPLKSVIILQQISVWVRQPLSPVTNFCRVDLVLCCMQAAHAYKNVFSVINVGTSFFMRRRMPVGGFAHCKIGNTVNKRT